MSAARGSHDVDLSMSAIRGRLRERDELHVQPDRAWAATALILHDHPEAGPEALFIERAHRRSDRWSGQMALPGGRRDATDPDLVHTARRETAEEVGVDLGDPIGRLPDVGSRPRSGQVATVAFEVATRPPLTLEPAEVQAAVWIPLTHLFDATNTARYRYRGMGPFTSIRHGERVVWGLTWGILDQFAELLGTSLPRL